MKLIVRIDDIGYSDINNIGAFKAIEEGIATAADVMLDTPGTDDALRRLKEMPWISIGWHTHFWGSPVLPAEQVPSLIQENGHFKADLHTNEDVSYDELIAELEAQLMKCQRILGRMPAYTGEAKGDSPFARAMRATCEKFGIVTNFMSSLVSEEFMPNLSEAERTWPAAPQWLDKGIFCPPCPFVGCIFGNDLHEILKYGENSKNYYIEDPDGLFTRTDYKAIVIVWHPGYVDDYMINEGEPGIFARHFDHVRYHDINTLTSKEYRQMVIDKKLELCSFTDAMYDRRDYQNHLCQIGSDLAVAKL